MILHYAINKGKKLYMWESFYKQKTPNSSISIKVNWAFCSQEKLHTKFQTIHKDRVETMNLTDQIAKYWYPSSNRLEFGIGNPRPPFWEILYIDEIKIQNNVCL